MRYLLKNAIVVSKGSNHNGKQVDILVNNGTIIKIKKSIKDEKAKLITSENLHVSIGWIDIGTHIGEPGHEQRETLDSLCQAALAGGYTDLVTFPNASPVIETKSQIENLKNEGRTRGVDIHPIGSLSTKTKGENISEYIDMIHAGAVGFSDGLKSVQKSGLLLRALQYAKGKGAIVFHHPTDHNLDNENQIHEGLVSIKLGLKGSPDLAETIMIERDIQLQKYTESKLCLHAISSKNSVDRIKKAKETSKILFSSVSYLNLVANDESLQDYDTNYKVKPVLRSKQDQTALIKGVKNETIDFITSNHKPLEPEAKQLEFPYADSGATGLETSFAAVNTFIAQSLPLDTYIAGITQKPREILAIVQPQIKVGEMAKLTCWDPNIEWVYNSANKKSKSANNPFINKTLKGRVIATINGKSTFLL